MRDPRSRRRPNLRPPSILPLVVLLAAVLFRTASARSTSTGPSGLPRLHCMSCVMVPGDTTQLDQFRVRQGLIEPWCEMESVECAPQQDTCVTVSMQVSPHRFWMGAGCDQRVNYDIPSDRDGCVDLQTFTRSIQPDHIEERRAFQQVCLCSNDNCNHASTRHSGIVLWLLVATIFTWSLL